ncbi:hypothetical protein A4U61_07980 [Streptomyces sp. H-KF8]|nr:hypothetical protein A4U61_07980 [Streptomyces sp. H-KF8]
MRCGTARLPCSARTAGAWACTDPTTGRAYSLPCRVGAATAERPAREALPVSGASALDIDPADRLLACPPTRLTAEVTRSAQHRTGSSGRRSRLAAKKAEHGAGRLSPLRGR